MTALPPQPRHEIARIAYFSMEVALESGMPTYSGGLGVLAADLLRSAADAGLALVGVTLLHRRGYFRQHLDAFGAQTESPADWQVERWLRELPERVVVRVADRHVQVRAWQYDLQGIGGVVPVYFLDTDLPENAPADRALTQDLYGGDAAHRLGQEIVLGIGGVRMLRALGHRELLRFHMNEGHSSLLALELLDESAARDGRTTIDRDDVENVRRLCVFTTHTPVAAAHDRFPLSLVDQVLGRPEIRDMPDVFCCGGEVNLTYLALNLSHYVNGVAKRHGRTAQSMFEHWRVDAITNGVHAPTWTAPPFRNLYDRWIPGWREDAFDLRSAAAIPHDEIWAAHVLAKHELLQCVLERSARRFDPDVMTLGFARRATAYKRAELLVSDPSRLTAIAERHGGLQIVYAGKAHPQDDGGKQVIRRVFAAIRELGPAVRAVWVEDYDLELAQRLVAGVDLWINTPQPPLEASGTSGMKAALNGVPSLSVLDGWWLEAHVEGVTGWAIGNRGDHPLSQHDEALELYRKLDDVILPMFRGEGRRWIDVMRRTIALNGSFFNSQRMLQQYAVKAYLD